MIVKITNKLCTKSVATLYEVHTVSWEDGPASQPAHGVDDPINVVDGIDTIFTTELAADERVFCLQRQKGEEGYTPKFVTTDLFAEQTNGSNYFRAYSKRLEIDVQEIQETSEGLLYQGRKIHKSSF